MIKPAIDLYQSGYEGLELIPCFICERTCYVRRGTCSDKKWALCKKCHDRGYIIILKESGEFEYQGPVGTFSGPYPK